MEKMISLAHGAGGKQSAELINDIFRKYFDSPLLTADDAAVLAFAGGRLAFSTDGFIVSPPQFAGGDIGKLSICGTVNDLACMGAKPLYLTCAFIIEEGFSLAQLERIADSMQKTAVEAGIAIVAGDTKVVGKGQCDGIFITTTGIGQLTEGLCPSGSGARVGDAVIVSGDIGRHGCAILLARDSFGITADCSSDCAPLWQMVSSMFDVTKDIHVLRDATRGGVGTVLYEIAAQSQVGIKLDAQAIPVSREVAGICGMLGLEPLYLACEGRMVIIAPQCQAPLLLAALHQDRHSQNAAIIGEVTADLPGRVVVKTAIGGQTLLPPPTGELLPRIC